jgi:hypothetical protein
MREEGSKKDAEETSTAFISKIHINNSYQPKTALGAD